MSQQSYKYVLFALCFAAFFVASTLAQTPKTFRGSVSYYADRFHGRVMSNGQRYHRDSLTCAHLTLPFGTLLRIHNPENDSTVIVRVTDRGPYSKRFIVDLSRAAATKIGIIHKGHTVVNISICMPQQTPYIYQVHHQLPPTIINYNIIDSLSHQPRFIFKL